MAGLRVSSAPISSLLRFCPTRARNLALALGQHFADSFGAGANGPLLIAADLSAADDTNAVRNLTTAIGETPGVAAATPPRVNVDGDAALVTVIPETGPQDQATEDLVHTLRDDVIPDVTDGTGLEAHVGGVSATNIDANENVSSRLPYLLAV